MAGRLFHESNVTPEIRVDGMLHDEIPMLLVKRPEGGRKQINGAAGDEAMNVKPPGLQRLRKQQRANYKTC
jgi:hypothetical protein